jgi:DNA-binding transcriptional LysR family regulator
VALTPAGEAFLPQARASLAAAAAAVEGARRAARGETGRLVVGMIVGTQIEPTSRILRAFRARYPDVALELVEHDFSDPSAGVNAREVDAAFVMPPIHERDLELLVLHEEPRVAVVPAGHRLAGRASVSVRELFADPWIVAETADRVCRDFWLATAHRDGVPPALGSPTRSIDKFIQLVMTERLVGLAAGWAVPVFARPGVVFVPVDDVEPATTALAWPRGSAHPVLARLVEVAREVVGGR